jgi:hypothetical protein
MSEFLQAMKSVCIWFLTLCLWTGIMLMFWYAVFNGDI